LVVLVLVVLWVAVLTPRLLRHLREVRSIDSIESFHEQLHLLERAGPKLVEPAYRLEVPDSDRSFTRLTLVNAGDAAHATPRLVRGVRQKHLVWERRRSRRRRRDLLLSLSAIAVLTGGLGAMHAFHLLWAITGVSALTIAAYIALAAYAQLLHADRDATRPVPSRLRDDPAVWGDGRLPPAPSATAGTLEVLAAGSLRAARAGYPGAWDHEELAPVLKGRAASGV
jgi:hypothetical protein